MCGRSTRRPTRASRGAEALSGLVRHLDAGGWALLAVSPLVGSFVGTVIRRLPDGEPLWRGRSRCESCGALLRPRDLMPLVSWGIAAGRCRHCGAELGWFYPAVEAATIALALISLAVDGGADAWLNWLLGCWLLALGWIDLRRGVLPDVLTLPLLAAGLVAAAWSPPELLDRALGAALGYIALRALALVYRRLRGREGLGGGDAKLFAACGAWVGASGLAGVVFGAATGALLAALCWRLAGRELRRDTELPFGPFLAAAAWIVWLAGPLPL